MYRILLAEDDIIVAADVTCELIRQGLQIAGVASSLAETLHLIGQVEFDLALLNVELADGLSYDAARRLNALGIPFVFFTSYEREEILPEFRHVPLILKPQIAPRVVGRVGSIVHNLFSGPSRGSVSDGS
ncbi:response regulator [Loktanella sp. M215]|uniref:response regulator n=1 Tax=Loktanella sp. M215 TaxID=2675431 RepID=UPI001F2FA7DF|nr:response regulator [Loktanella sp. M215]MCF7701908.1 response regulator [Loktanella sp. M215]